MWWIIQIIIAVIFILITVYILKDTHVKVYKNYHTKLKEEYDLELPIWALLLIVLIYLIPFINIVVFIAFLIYYIFHTVGNLEDWDDEILMYSLNGNNWVTKSLLAIKEILNKKI